MIAIIDYNAGNLRSVQKAFQFIGAEAKLTSDPEEILSADAVVLPGVGAFKDCMDSLKRKGLQDTVKLAVSSGKPFLGICLGFQMLFEESEEHAKENNGNIPGLGIFKGTVRKLELEPSLKVPHMGWNSIQEFYDNCDAGESEKIPLHSINKSIRTNDKSKIEKQDDGKNHCKEAPGHEDKTVINKTLISHEFITDEHCGHHTRNQLFKSLPANPYVYFVHSFYVDAADPGLVTARATYGKTFDVAIAKGNVYATQFHPEKSGDIGLQMLRNFLELI